MVISRDLVRALEKENRLLKQENSVCKAQGRLFELLIEMAGSAAEQKMLKISMLKTLEVTARLSGARMGSLFLLNQEGVVTDSLLTREKVSPTMRSKLVGSVLDNGLAGWVRSHHRVGIIDDTQKDSRWLSLPEEPYKVRSAMAVPIIKHESLFGILTLMHPLPGHFNKESIEIVQIAATYMALAIESAQQYIKLDELHRLRQKAMERDLKLARAVQESFLPAQVPKIEGFCFAAMNRPALEVGGDFYHFFKLPGGKLGVAIGDVSGKGVAASLFMARFSSDLQYYAFLYTDPCKLFSKLNRQLCARAKQGMFVTLVYILLDVKTGQISFSNAGHISPVFVDEQGVQVLGSHQAKGPPLGIVPEAEYGQDQFLIKKNGMILIYTDGVIEAKNQDQQLYGFDRLEKIVQGCTADSATLVQKVLSSVDRFSRDRGQTDDLTMVCFKREASGPRFP
ncbi:MAG: SpoIIE family protein phosphatase [Desulfobacteraceae bacterium]|nr:SpoIIE family protein phosphatase [Desulfobacteraceae bacterium]